MAVNSLEQSLCAPAAITNCSAAFFLTKPSVASIALWITGTTCNLTWTVTFPQQVHSVRQWKFEFLATAIISSSHQSKWWCDIVFNSITYLNLLNFFELSLVLQMTMWLYLPVIPTYLSARLAPGKEINVDWSEALFSNQALKMHNTLQKDLVVTTVSVGIFKCAPQLHLFYDLRCNGSEVGMCSPVLETARNSMYSEGAQQNHVFPLPS